MDPIAPFGPDGELLLDDSICRDRDAAVAREWLVGNGIGGYAFGTIAGAATRRYHGVLVAATRPPAERTMVLARVEERLLLRGVRQDLATDFWSDGTVNPRGYAHLESFRLERGLPVWRWRFDEAVLEKRLAMVYGANATLLEYRLVAGSIPAELSLDLVVANRPHHALDPQGQWTAQVERRGDAVVAHLPPTPVGGARCELYVHAPGMDVRPSSARWRAVDLPAERDRGYDATDSLLLATTLVSRLEPGERRCIGASLGLPLPRDPAVLLGAEQARRQGLLDGSRTSRSAPARRQAVLAADAFVVRRPLDASRPFDAAQEGWSIIAGYPWFADWSRDTLLSLPGLLLSTGRTAAARGVLATCAKHLSAGMLPNRYPDRPGDAVIYNSIDAPLLFIRAVGLTARLERDGAWVAALWPALLSIVGRFEEGTRHGIGVDPEDGLVRGGEAGVQLTWMDAKVGERVVTPRIGKPVEINALWYAALRHLEELAPRCGASPQPFAAKADRVKRSFARYWDDSTRSLVDVLDGPDQPVDASVRPNQILAAGLEFTPLDLDAVRGVVARTSEDLLVPIALRTLSNKDPRYRGRYEGGVAERDEAYHQGSAWPWLIPFFARAWRRAGEDPTALDAIVEAFSRHLGESGIGSVSELVDGDFPHCPRGCPAQAWSVAALLELLDEVALAKSSATTALAEAGR